MLTETTLRDISVFADALQGGVLISSTPNGAGGRRIFGVCFYEQGKRSSEDSSVFRDCAEDRDLPTEDIPNQ